MDNILELAQQNSAKATKTKKDYANSVFDLIDSIILRASEYENVTGIFMAQLTSKLNRLFQVMYRETNSPVDHEYEYTHGSDTALVAIDDNCVTIEEIADHYAKLGFLTGVKVFAYSDYIQYRILISWSDEESIDDKVNIHKYVNGEDIYKDNSHPEDY